MAKKVSKGKVIDNLVRALRVDDYTQLEDRIGKIIQILSIPVAGVMIAWKPLVQGSLSYKLLGIPETPEAIEDAAHALRAVSDDVSHRALTLAIEMGREEVPENEEEQQRGQTDRIGDAVDTSGDEA